jgi:hypothetical protein
MKPEIALLYFLIHNGLPIGKCQILNRFVLFIKFLHPGSFQFKHTEAELIPMLGFSSVIFVPAWFVYKDAWFKN